MSLFSNSVKVVTTATPNFTVESYEGPNIGQYGWTKADTGHYNQLIQYVEECRHILEQVQEIQGGLPAILVYIEEIRKTHDEIMATQKEIEDSLVVFETNYRDFMARYAEFSATYIAFQNQYVDFLNKGQEIIGEARDAALESSQYASESQDFSLQSKGYSVDSSNYSIVSKNHSLESKSFADLSKTHADSSQAFSVESSGFADVSESWYKKSEELYEELRKGQVYRGAWNPHSGAWPDNGGTNSVWDVVLNEGDDSFSWSGITWRWGDRLVYIKDSNSYQQISSGKGVLSVNGKTGSVSLNYEDVAAVASAHRGNWDTTGNVINNVVGQLAWKNYGANHVIFDASKGTSPSNTTIDPVNSQNVWNSSYPTLMGWNGSHTYGVRVDSSRHADVAASASFANDLRGGTISTQGRDLVIDGKRALVGINGDETLYINYSADYPNVTVGGNLNAASTAVSRLLVLNNGSSSYGDAGIEVRVGDGATQTPRISMHRPGVNGSAFALGADGTVTLESTTPSAHCNFRAGAFYSSVPATSADQLTRKDYVDGLIGSRTNFVNRGQRSDVNITNGEGSFTWHPSVANNPIGGSFAHGISFGGSPYQDGQWVSDLVWIHGNGLYHRATVNGGIGTWEKISFSGTANYAPSTTRFINQNGWAAGAFGAFEQANVVLGSMENAPVIGGHNAAHTAWADIYLNCQPSTGAHGGVILGNPHARNINDGTSYKMYHTGFKPTAAEVGALSLNGGTVNGTIRKAGGGDFIVADQGGVVNRELQIYNNGGDAVFRSDLNQDGDSAGTFSFVGAKLSTSAQFEPKAPATTATALTHLTGNTSSIRFPNVQVPRVATSYVEMLHGSSQVEGVGYVGRLSMGAKRSNNPDWGSAYIAYGGSDGYPTKEWLFQSTTGNFISSGSLVSTAEHPISTKGGILRANRDDIISLDGARYSFVVSPQDAHLCTNSYYDGAWKKHDAGNNSWILVTKPSETPHFMYSPAGNSNPYLTKYRIYHEGFKPSSSDLGVIGVNKDNILNNPSFGVGFLTSDDKGAPWIASYFGKNGGVNQVVVGEIGQKAVIGSHTAAKNAWAPLYINTSTGGDGEAVYIKDPRAITGSGTYAIYHQGFKPTSSDVGAAPSGFGLGETQATTVLDLNSDPNTWAIAGKFGWFRATTGSENRPDNQAGIGLLTRYANTSTSVVYLTFTGNNGNVYTRRWSGSEWGAWRTNYDTGNKPHPSDIGAVNKSGDTINGNLTINYGMDGVQHLVFNNNLNAMMGTYIKRFISYLDQDNMTAWAWRATSGGVGVSDKMVLTKEGNLSVAGEISADGQVKSTRALTVENSARTIQLHAESTPGGICFMNLNNSEIRPIEFFDEGFIRINPQKIKGVDRQSTGAVDILNQFHAGGIAAFTYGINGGYHFAINVSNGNFEWLRSLMTLHVHSGDMQLIAGGFAQNGFHTGSDIRFKDKIEAVSREGGSWLDKICSLNATSFVYKNNPETPRLGFVAQDVQDVIPDAVTVKEVNRPGATENTDMVDRLFLDPMAIIAAQNEAIKELVEKFNALEERLKVLEGLN